VVIGHTLNLPVAPVTAVELILCFWLRVMAIRYGWRLPVAKFRDQHDSSVAKGDSKDPDKFLKRRLQSIMDVGRQCRARRTL